MNCNQTIEIENKDNYIKPYKESMLWSSIFIYHLYKSRNILKKIKFNKH
jgi:hypothetical protein